MHFYFLLFIKMKGFELIKVDDLNFLLNNNDSASKFIEMYCSLVNKFMKCFIDLLNE